MLSVTDSMQVTKETSCMCKQCVPGAPSDFLSALDQGYPIQWTCVSRKETIFSKSLKIKGWGPIFKHKKGAVPTVKQKWKLNLLAWHMHRIHSNKHHPWIVAAASKHGRCTRMQMISDDGHHASTRTSHSNSWKHDWQAARTTILLTASNNHHCLTHTYPYPAVIDVPGLSKEINAALE